MMVVMVVMVLMMAVVMMTVMARHSGSFHDCGCSSIAIRPTIVRNATNIVRASWRLSADFVKRG